MGETCPPNRLPFKTIAGRFLVYADCRCNAGRADYAEQQRQQDIDIAINHYGC